MIAQEFVRTTRFDPFHEAASEQELFDRLPGVLSHFRHNSSMVFEMSGASNFYSITLERDRIVDRAESIYREILSLVEKMQKEHGKGHTSLALQLSHRVARLPGCREMLAALKDVQIIELDRGAAASGIPKIWAQLAAQRRTEGISFFSSRPWQFQPKVEANRRSADEAGPTEPTHLLYRSIAFPIADQPLTVGCAQSSQPNELTIAVEAAGVAPRHCKIERRGGEIILTDTSAGGTFVDEKRVSGSIALKLGQVIRVGNPGEQLQLIACLNRNET
jgi:hypothetical protein